jgi:hypothetical protein
MVVDSGEISLSKRSQTLIQNHELIRDSVQVSHQDVIHYLWIFLEIFVGEVVAEIEFDVALLERDLKIKIVASRTEAGFEISEEMESVCWHFPKASNRDCQYLFTLQEYWDYLGRLSTVVNPRKTLP